MLITTKRVFLSVDCGYHAADSRFQIPDSRFQIPGTGFQPFSVELGLWIPIVSGIPDSLSCIPDSKAQDTGLRKQNFPRFRYPRAKICRILESFTDMG